MQQHTYWLGNVELRNQTFNLSWTEMRLFMVCVWLSFWCVTLKTAKMKVVRYLNFQYDDSSLWCFYWNWWLQRSDLWLSTELVSLFVLPSILLSTALCRSGFCRASRFLSSLAQTMKAFIGLRILCSAPAAFPSPADVPPARFRSGLCPPELCVKHILGSPLLIFPVLSGELQSSECFCSKPISEAGLGVLEVQGPPRDTWLTLERLGLVKFIPEKVYSRSNSANVCLSLLVCKVLDKNWNWKYFSQQRREASGEEFGLRAQIPKQSIEMWEEGETRIENKPVVVQDFPWKRSAVTLLLSLSTLGFLFASAVYPRFDFTPSLGPSDTPSPSLSAHFESLETCGQIWPTHAVYIYPALTNRINTGLRI